MRALRFAAILSTLLAVGLPAAWPASPGHHRPRVQVHFFGGFWSPYPLAGFYGPPYAYGPAYRPYRVPRTALVDTDVSPEEARVFLDEEEIGRADDFDGFPDYLEVEPGRHTLEFRLKGFRTLRITLNARRGQTVEISRELRRGSRDDDDTITMGRALPPPPPHRSPGWEDDDEEANDRGPRSNDHEPGADDREGEDDDERYPAEERDSPSADRGGEEPEESGATISLRLRPSDADVYLDGRLLGDGESGEDVESIPVTPGRHTIRVTKPGFQTYRTTVVIEEDETKTLTIRLLPTPEEDEDEGL